VHYRDTHTDRLLFEAIDVEYVIGLLDKDKILDLETYFKRRSKQSIDIVDFVRLTLNILPHSEYETLFLTMALVDLFQEISESLGMAPMITLRDITNRICEVIFIILPFIYFGNLFSFSCIKEKLKPFSN
jgi:hypothetical protein